MNPPKLGSREMVYENRFQQIFKVQADFGEFTKDYFVTEAGRRSGVVVIHQGTVLLVRQYRLSIDGLSWEIPGGGMHPGETPESAAMRECFEETGVRSINLRPLAFYYEGLDMIRNPTHIFYTDEVTDQAEPPQGRKVEIDSFEWVPFNRCIEMISKGDILDSFTIIGISRYQSQVCGV